MATVERLLTAGSRRDRRRGARQPRRPLLPVEYYKELDARFDDGFDLSQSLPIDDAVFLVARLRGEPVGCGAIKLAESYLKRMWIAPAARGLGLGRRMLHELEQLSRTPVVRLETNKNLPRSDRPLPRGGLRGGPAVQRRALRPPLVREAPLNILPAACP